MYSRIRQSCTLMDSTLRSGDTCALSESSALSNRLSKSPLKYLLSQHCVLSSSAVFCDMLGALINFNLLQWHGR
jgi:hypothetical protein